MRALKLIAKVLLAAMAVIAGLFVAAAVAVAGVTLFLVGKLLGKSHLQVTGSRLSRRSKPAPSRSKSDAIDVTATEVTPQTALPSSSARP